jgi:hypothetical protein
MSETKNTKGEIENLLGEVRNSLAGMRDVLDDPAATTLGNAADFVKSLEGIVENIDKADEELAEVLSTLEDAEIVGDARDHTEHVLRALKHLGVQGLDAFTDADMRMAMEQTENL